MEREKTLFDKFQAFSWSQMSDASELFKAIKKTGMDVGSFISAIDEEIESRKRRIKEDEKKAKAAYDKLIESQGKKKKQPAPPPAKEKKYSETMRCPECGQVAYAQSVCPNCSKGKAGIKRQYICGECNFAFYLD